MKAPLLEVSVVGDGTDIESLMSMARQKAVECISAAEPKQHERKIRYPQIHFSVISLDDECVQLWLLLVDDRSAADVRRERGTAVVILRSMSKPNAVLDDLREVLEGEEWHNSAVRLIKQSHMIDNAHDRRRIQAALIRLTHAALHEDLESREHPDLVLYETCIMCLRLVRKGDDVEVKLHFEDEPENVDDLDDCKYDVAKLLNVPHHELDLDIPLSAIFASDYWSEVLDAGRLASALRSQYPKTQ